MAYVLFFLYGTVLQLIQLVYHGFKVFTPSRPVSFVLRLGSSIRRLARLARWPCVVWMVWRPTKGDSTAIDSLCRFGDQRLNNLVID